MNEQRKLFYGLLSLLPERNYILHYCLFGWCEQKYKILF